MYIPGASIGSPILLPTTMIAVGEPRPLPAPLPDAAGRPITIPGSPPLIETVLGSAGDDQILLPTGGLTNGLGGNDTFVLLSSGKAEGLELLGTILDYNEGDQLDLSRLGEGAAIVSREAAPRPGGPERVTIDYDGDGAEDGYVLLSSGRTPDMGDVRPMPMPTPIDDGQFHILPFPMPGDGPISIQPVPDGAVRILPYPMPGDGPFTVPSAPGAELTAFASLGEVEPLSEAVFTILPYAGEGMAGAIGLAAHTFVFSDPAYSAEWIG